MRDWRTWALYAVPMGVAIATYAVKGNYGSKGVPLHWIPEYLERGWTIGFVPALAGIRVPQLGEAALHSVAVISCQVVLLAAVAVSVGRWRGAWRAWAVLALAFSLNALVLIPRLAIYGTDVIVYTLRYFNESVYVAFLVVPFAFVLPQWAQSGRPRPARWTLPRIAAVVAALVAYVAFVWVSDAAFTRHWPGRISRAWADNVRADLERLDRAGVRPVLLNGPLPPTILPPFVKPHEFPPPNYLSAVLPIVHPAGLRFDEVSNRTYWVRPDGHLEAVRFVPATGGDVPRLRAAGLLKVTGAATLGPAFGLCAGAGSRSASLELFPGRSLRGRAWYLETTYATDAKLGLPLVVDRGVGYPPVADRFLPWRPVSGTQLTALGSLPTGVPTLARVRIDVTGVRACFSRFVFGSYVGQRAQPAGSQAAGPPPS